jgi:hypothetical protein
MKFTHILILSRPIGLYDSIEKSYSSETDGLVFYGTRNFIRRTVLVEVS